MAALLIAQNAIGNLSAGDALGNLPRDLTEPFSVVIGFTFDAVYRKLAETDVTHTGAVAVKKS
jgi:hypothetical protein